MPKLTADEYEMHRDENDGWCVRCKDWTRGECEPDATRYECPDCGRATVYGAEEAMILGIISIEDED